MKWIKRIMVGMVVVTGSVMLLALTPPGERYFEIARNLEVFAALFKEVNALYVDDVNPNKLARTGIDAMLNSLDPYTNYIPEDEIEDFKMVYNLEYGGIGAVTRQINGRTVVTLLYEGYPAARNGLKIGDEIIEIDGVNLKKITPEEASLLQRGPVGSTVTLTLQRPGATDLLKLPFRREQIKINNVPYFGMVSAEVGYALLSDFTPNAGQEVKKAIVDMKSKGAKKIILDLRNNPGGRLDEAVNICNLFLPKGKLVVTMKGKVKENNRIYETVSAPLDTEIPVVVLINRHSASASEIVAGTLQDYDRAVIVGEKSFGKGLVQTNYPVSYKGQVKITIAKYYTPTGRCIQALDYTHRRDDGSVGSVADSLKKAYKTSSNRIVYDGGGIDPDVQVEPFFTPAIAQVLYNNGYILDFSSNYALAHKTIAPAATFSLTDAEYQEFTNWVKSKDYNYPSPVELQLATVVEKSKKESAYQDLKGQLDQLQARMIETRKHDLVRHKEAIRKMLEEDITSRYYLEKGTIESAFRYDHELKEALQLLGDEARIRKILNQ